MGALGMVGNFAGFVVVFLLLVSHGFGARFRHIGLMAIHAIPSRERSHIQPWQKENHFQKCRLAGDMLVPMVFYFWMGNSSQQK